MKNKNRIQAKDLITVGIFTAIMMVVRIISSFLGVIPIVNAIITVPVCIAVGPVYMLFLTKVKKMWMITIMAGITGIFMSVFGWAWFCAAIALVCGLIADFITKLGNYQSYKLGLAGYCVYSLWWIAPVLPVWFQPGFLDNMRESMGAEFVQAYSTLMPIWMLPVLIVVTIISALIGGLLGKRMMKKHFVRSGIA